MIQDRNIPQSVSDVCIGMMNLNCAIRSKQLLERVIQANMQWLDTVKAALNAEGFEI